MLADVLPVYDTMCAGGKNGTSGDRHVIDDIHNTLMSYIREQPCTWAPILSSVSILWSGFYYCDFLYIALLKYAV